MTKIKYYETISGRTPVREFIQSLSQETREEVIVLLRRLENEETIGMPQCRNLSSIAKGLLELRIRDEFGNIRIFFFVKSAGIIYLIHACRKKARIISPDERKLILRRMKEIRLYKEF